MISSRPPPPPPPPLQLLLLLLLCGHTVRSQRGFCSEDRCYAIFQESSNLNGAEKRCKEADGLLARAEDVAQIQTRLFRSFSGASSSFWLRRGGNCSSVSVSADRSVSLGTRSCLDNLDGFLCSYKNLDPCLSLRNLKFTPEVKYNTYMGFEALDSDTFPMGTVAVSGKTGGKYPDSKHVCVSGMWLQAPWNCEVFEGGCEHECNKTDKTGACFCRPGETLSSNGFSCSADPCVECEQECEQHGNQHTCKCRKGYRLGQDRKSCVDVDECVEGKPCTRENEECVNKDGGYACGCKYGYMLIGERCVDARICEKCEQDCNIINGKFQCQCRTGFKVNPLNHTKCVFNCTEGNCMARCIKTINETDCFCPDGYILQTINDTDICTDIDECVNDNPKCHKCENFNGGYKCSCNKGYVLGKNDKCKLIKADFSTSTQVNLTPAVVRSSEGLPSYVKMGSILSIAVFVLVCFALLVLLIRWFSKHCKSVNMPRLKDHNIDIFYLQQVTSETYKRLSFDKPKNDMQIL